MSVCSIVDVLLQLQCNVFEGTSGEVTLTAAGGVRQLPGPAGSEIHENAALVLLYNNFFTFPFQLIFFSRKSFESVFNSPRENIPTGVERMKYQNTNIN